VPEIKANGEFFKAQAVFTGTVLSQRYAKTWGWFYRVQVMEVFRGPVAKALIVYTGDDSNRFPLERGGEYLLFAYRRDGRLVIDSCGNSALLSEATQSLQLIRGIASATDGEVEGWLAPETDGVDLSGIHVVIRGESDVYRVITDNEGYFHFPAPEGKYVVDFSNHEYYLNGGDRFWYGPIRFRLHAGEAAALQMVSVRHPKRQQDR
jgi:hypothetical protein